MVVEIITMASLRSCALFLTILHSVLFQNAYAGLPRSGRIVGGTEITIDKAPYMAALQFKLSEEYYFLMCGGSIVSDKYILTAAHCDPLGNLPIYFARVGSTIHDKGGVMLKVEKFTPHPNYDSLNMDYDIGLVSFGSVMIPLGPNIQIIPIGEPGNDPDEGVTCIINGWGQDEDDDYPDSLFEANVPIFSQQTCKNTFTFLNERHVCLGGQGVGGICFGDSGGPAVYNGVQVGVSLAVTSMGCGASEIPDLHARVSTFKLWIDSIIN